MARAFLIKQGSTSPSLSYFLEPAALIDLTGATVTFSMRDSSGMVTIMAAPVTIVTATGLPEVRYDWLLHDLDVPDVYEAEFAVTYQNGTTEIFPTKGYISIMVYDAVVP